MQLAWLLVALFATTACQGRPRPEPASRVSVAARSVHAPAPADRGTRCADVGRVRACWAHGCAHGVCLVPRPVPDAPHVGQWRCAGSGNKRTCTDRALDASRFHCVGELCVQRTTRMPDDGQWECAAFDGAVLCRSIAPAAGVVAGPPDPAFLCGARRGHPGQRVCVDFAPDMPAAGAWHCHFQHLGGVVERVCERGGRLPLGDACSGGCEAGSSCVSNRCLPLAPHPDCYFDKDCGAGARCALGTCRKAT